MEIVSSFLLGFITMWFAIRINHQKPKDTNLKKTMIEMVNIYGYNEKICKGLKEYSMDRIKNGNYEFAEVIETVKRQKNDKTRT